MFHSKERQAKIAKDKLKDKAVVETRGDAEGVTLGFNTSEKPEKYEKSEMLTTRTRAEEILFRKF